MDILQIILTIVGLVVVLVFTYTLISETIRAARQSHRFATAQTRLSLGKRKTNFKYWWVYFKTDFMSHYSSKNIGPYSMDHNPSIKTTRAFETMI
jgi:Flp pilus assembly protein TadB